MWQGFFLRTRCQCAPSGLREARCRYRFASACSVTEHEISIV